MKSLVCLKMFEVMFVKYLGVVRCAVMLFERCICTQGGEGPLTCRCGRKDTLVAFLPDSKNFAYMRLTPGADRDSVKQKMACQTANGTRGPNVLDVLSASFLDVAVLRCLFCLSWQEDGIYWALRCVCWHK
jgi:hypothetical protein